MNDKIPARRRKLRDTDIAAALDSSDSQMRALARTVEHALARCADLERLNQEGTLDRATALKLRDDLDVAQAEHSYHATALLALVVAAENGGAA